MWLDPFLRRFFLGLSISNHIRSKNKAFSIFVLFYSPVNHSMVLHSDKYNTEQIKNLGVCTAKEVTVETKRKHLSVHLSFHPSILPTVRGGGCRVRGTSGRVVSMSGRPVLVCQIHVLGTSGGRILRTSCLVDPGLCPCSRNRHRKDGVCAVPEERAPSRPSSVREDLGQYTVGSE